MRTWAILVPAMVLLLAWQFFKIDGAISPSNSENSIGIASQSPPQGTQATETSVGGQRELIEATGFQPPRDARNEIEQLTDAGISRAAIRDKLTAAGVLVTEAAEAEAQTPAPSAAAEPADDAALIDNLNETIEAWRRAWEEGDAERYMEFYANDFRPATGVPRASWQRQRLARVVTSKEITLSLSDISIALGEGGESATVEFVQDYTSAEFSQSSSKQLTLIRTNTQWYISAEREL